MPASPATPPRAGSARLDWSVPEGTDAVILELGANDMLRGVDPKVTREALEQIVRKRLKARGIEVLLSGMRAAPNLGRGLQRAIRAIYPELAATYGLRLLSVLPRRRRRADSKLESARRPASERGRRSSDDRCMRKSRSAAERARSSCWTSASGTIARPRSADLMIGLSSMPPASFHRSRDPADVGQSLSMLRGGLPGARWIDPENYHVTLALHRRRRRRHRARSRFDARPGAARRRSSCGSTG